MSLPTMGSGAASHASPCIAGRSLLPRLWVTIQFVVTLIAEFEPGALLVGEFHEVAERFQPTVPGTQFGPIERRALPIRGVVPFLHALNLGPGERCFT